MPPRLSALDASFLYLEEASTPMHVGAVSIFKRPKDGFDYDRLVRHIQRRIAYVPRYRQRVRDVPGHLASPVRRDDRDVTRPRPCRVPHAPADAPRQRPVPRRRTCFRTSSRLGPYCPCPLANSTRESSTSARISLNPTSVPVSRERANSPARGSSNSMT